MLDLKERLEEELGPAAQAPWRIAAQVLSDFRVHEILKGWDGVP